MKISVIGLGKLGAPLAVVFASKGFPVVGTDLNPVFVDAINDGRTPVDEPRLQELISENRERLRATTDAAAAVAETDVTFVIVPTPSGPDRVITSPPLASLARRAPSAAVSPSSCKIIATRAGSSGSRSCPSPSSIRVGRCRHGLR